MKIKNGNVSFCLLEKLLEKLVYCWNPLTNSARKCFITNKNVRFTFTQILNNFKRCFMCEYINIHIAIHEMSIFTKA